LLRELVENASEQQVDAWYASTEGRALDLDAVRACSCEVSIAHLTFAGYATIVAREVASLTLFEPDVVLSGADVLDEENWMALRLLGLGPEQATDGEVVVRYSLKLTGFGAPGILSVPYARPAAT
jgi:hypothetical protein